MLSAPGRLNIKCINADLKRDTELFGKMDPYVKITIGSQTKKTRTHNSGGKHPRWEETLNFYLNKEEEMRIAVYDKDMTKDDLVGETIYFLDDVRAKRKYKEALKLAYKGKDAGTLSLEFDFQSDVI